MYNSNILLVMEYGCTVWGSWTASYNNVIHRLQKRAARIVSGKCDFINVRGDYLYCELKWTHFEDRVRYLTCSLMFKAIHGDAPQWMNNNILMSCESHNRQTRNANPVGAGPGPQDIWEKSLDM